MECLFSVNTLGRTIYLRSQGAFIVREIRHNIVSYYMVKDIVRQSFEDGNILIKMMRRSSQDPRLEGISLRQELASLLSSSFLLWMLRRLHQGAEVTFTDDGEATGKHRDDSGVKQL